MKLNIDGKNVEVSLFRDGSFTRVEVDGETFLIKDDKNHYHVSGNKEEVKSFNFDNNQLGVQIEDEYYNIKIDDSVSHGNQKISAPIAGKITSIKVKKNQDVKKGEVLLTMTSMKMENEILAENNCKIIDILILNDQVVEKGEILIETE